MTSDDRFIISTCVNDRYLKYWNQFIGSLREVSSVPVCCRLINTTSEPHAGVTYIADNTPLCDKKQYIKDLGPAAKTVYDANLLTSQGIRNKLKTMYSQSGVYSCHSRFKNILMLLESGVQTILSLDVDTIFNKRFDTILDGFIEDLGVITENINNTVQYFHNEGFLLINNNHKTKDFFNTITHKMFEDDTYLDWDADSRLLNETYDANRLQIKQYHKKYKCKEHLEESVMWSGDGVNKYKPTFK